MRRTRLLLAAAVVVLGVAAPASAVLAQEEGEATDPVEEVIHEAEENGATHADAECIEILAEGGSADDCQAAPNQLVPETNEVLYGLLGFIVVFGFLAWKGLPAIKAGMNARTERIQADLDGAEAQRTEADTVLAEYKAQLADAKSESGRIIEEARQMADTMKRDLQAQAEADITSMRQRAAADIEAAKVQAIADLRSEVADIAIGAAERVVERSLDRDTSTQLVEAYIAQVGQS